MSTHRIAVIGGTGPQGRGLAYRWARHGHTVVLGSRAAGRQSLLRDPEVSRDSAASSDSIFFRS